MSKNIFENLITLEMANNHMGDFNHGVRMINEFSDIAKKYENRFNFAWKFQFRDIPSFIHPDYKNRMDIKYVKRFTETGLTDKELIDLKSHAESRGFLTMCTPFDENSVDRMNEMGFDIAKVASCSSTDWPLLNKLIKTNMPIIFSTAGTALEDIDKVVSFLQHRGQREYIHTNIAMMHCVGEYPTKIEDLQLNQIDLFKDRYKDVPVGFSTHESPEEAQAVQLAVAKGVRLFEKHVAVVTDAYPRNAYSATPTDIDKWLSSMTKAYDMCGVHNKRHSFSAKEISDLKQFRRGVYAKRKIEVGEDINDDNVFYAWPNEDDQLLSIDMSKFFNYTSKTELNINDPIFNKDIEKSYIRNKHQSIINDVKDLLGKSGVVFPGKADLEISHHYGIDHFYETGLTMITVINRQYCKKLLILLPKQKHPEQYHKKKEETFMVLYGDAQLKLNGVDQSLKKGDVVTIEKGVRHEFSSINGCIIEEVSSTHYADDSYYTDEKIHLNTDRKTIVTEWTSWDFFRK